MRTRRWTPASAAIRPNAYSPSSVNGRALDAGFFAGLIVEHLALEAAALGPLQIHAQQHLGPVLRLGAAGAGMDGDDGVGAIVLAAEHLLDLGGLDFALRARRARAADRADVLALPGPFEQHAEVVELAGQRVAQLDFVGQPAAALQRLLRLGLVLPEVGRGDAGFELGQLAGGVGGVKDSSAGLWRVAPGLRSGESDLRGRGPT